MTQTTVGNNARLQRKSLSEQIDRLDGILEGMADALNQSVADAVREVVGEVVRQAVEASITEVLASPELLRVALARHEPPAPQTPPEQAAPPRRTLGEVLRGCLARLWQKTCKTASQVKKGIGLAWSWCLAKLRRAHTLPVACCLGVAAGCVWLTRSGGAVACQLWRFRGACAAALAAGMVSGLGSYLAGPLAASTFCGLAGAALAAASLVLWPLARLLLGHDLEA